MSKNVSIVVRVEPKTKEAVKNWLSDSGVTMSEFVRSLINEAMGVPTKRYLTKISSDSNVKNCY